jgi:transposase-like protein
MIEEIFKNVRTTSSGRKLFTSEQKVYIVESWESSGLSAPEFCRQYGLFAAQLYKWRKDSQKGAIMGIRTNGEIHSKAELDALYRENEELKKALGEATLDNMILKKKLAMDAQRKLRLSASPKSFR